MQFLSYLAQQRVEVFWAMGAVAVLLTIWLWARASRRHYLTIASSETTERIAYQLERIADALERLAVTQKSPTPPAKGAEMPRISLSMLGR